MWGQMPRVDPLHTQLGGMRVQTEAGHEITATMPSLIDNCWTECVSALTAIPPAPPPPLPGDTSLNEYIISSVKAVLHNIKLINTNSRAKPTILISIFCWAVINIKILHLSVCVLNNAGKK